MDKNTNTCPPCFKDAEQRIYRIAERLPHKSVQNSVILHLIKHLWKWLADMTNEELIAVDLNPISFFTLLMLYAEGESNPSALSTCTGETRTNMTRICNELEIAGLIIRQPCSNDRRRINLTLSKAGIKQIEKLLPKFRARTTKIFSSFTKDEKTLLETLLKKLLMAFEQEANIDI